MWRRPFLHSSCRFGSVGRAAHYSPVGRGFKSFHGHHFCFRSINLFMESGSLQINLIAYSTYFNLLQLPKNKTTAHFAHSAHLEVIVKAAECNVCKAIKWLIFNRLVQDFRFTHDSAVSNYIFFFQTNRRNSSVLRPPRHAAAVF